MLELTSEVTPGFPYLFPAQVILRAKEGEGSIKVLEVDGGCIYI